MGKFKNEFTYLQKGVLFGGLFGIIYQIVVALISKTDFNVFGITDFGFPHFIVFIFFENQTIFSRILIVIWYISLGAIFGIIYEKWFAKTEKQSKIFYIGLLMLLVLIFLYGLEIFILGFVYH